jgi:hypothetical protein
MIKIVSRFSIAICCVLCSGCATPPRPAPAPAFLHAVTQPLNFPQYPVEYQDSPRVGQVYARCAVLPDRRLSDCTVLAQEGGEAFGKSTLAWLTAPDYRLPRRPPLPGDMHPSIHAFFITFTPPLQNFSEPVSQILSNRIAGGAAKFQPGYKDDRAGSVVADCTILPDGRPQDCRIVPIGFAGVLIAPALEWLKGEEVRYQYVAPPLSGPRRLVVVPFRPAA